LDGIQEVSGSIPLISTTPHHNRSITDNIQLIGNGTAVLFGRKKHKTR